MPLNLDQRQRAMLAEMGIRVWTPAQEYAQRQGQQAAPAAAVQAAHQTVPQAAPSAAGLSIAGLATAAPLPSRPIAAGGAAPAIAAAIAGADALAATPERAPPIDVSQHDWPALQAAVAGCRACGLCDSRTQTVFGAGSTQAQWLVVGEAPGEAEDRQGQPFVGPAGQLLDAMLAAIGLSRHAATTEQVPGGHAPSAASVPGQKQGVYIANVLKCRPPQNRNPQPDEMARCEPYLRRQVALLHPRLILAMGRFAVQALLQSDAPIGRLRGRVHHYEGVPVIVTYHPAYLLRSPAEKAKAWQDLCLALHTAQA